ncbi:MAG: aminoacyl-tRNA hydrolase [Chitinivibrionales bacterium]|nr:aminoacyl-tRNA hydrolase [Chitinivibrionales bacterium]
MRLFDYLRSLVTHRPARRIKFDACFFGIGNPGTKYGSTRHNIGFMAIDALSQSLAHTKRSTGCRSELLTGSHAAIGTVLCVKPQTYVNRCGDALKEVYRRYSFEQQSMLVIVDDFNLPLGSLRFRRGGSAGGHNGLKSIIAAFGQDIPRLRLGIGPLPSQTRVIDFVLGEFGSGELEKANQMLGRLDAALIVFAQHGIEAAMNRFNC